MIKLRKFLSNLLISIGMGGVFALFMIFASPRFLFIGKFYSASDMTVALSKMSKIPELTLMHRFYLGVAVFIIVSIFAGSIIKSASKKVEKKEFAKAKTKIFVNFLNRLRFCYTPENLVDAIVEELEFSGDCSVMSIDPKENIVLNNSPARFVSNSETFNSFKSISNELMTGIYFLDCDMKITVQKKARFVAVILDKIQFFIVCRYLNEVEPEIFTLMYSEFVSYQNRIETLNKLLYLSELTQEWNMVASTQRAFLPQKLPDIPDLDLGAFFQPLVNVSGDYYDVVKVDESKSLILLGDVSGKGLAAALVMGVVINTVKIAKDKEDLPALVRAIDVAIKRMKLMDKYTVLFLGLIDTKRMTIKYVNASMEDPMILTESPDGYKIKTLDSTCSIVGIIDLDDISVEERRLYRGDVILMLTDGIPESMNDEGVELGETEMYKDSIKSYASGTAQDIVNNVADLAYSYVGDKPMRDDMTMLCVKVKG